MNQRLLSAFLFFTVAVGCTEHSANDPAEAALAQEKTTASADGPSLQVKPTEENAPVGKPGAAATPPAGAPGIEVKATEDGVSIQGRPPVYPGGFRPHEQTVDPRFVEYQLSRLGPVDLTLSDLPPIADDLAPGRYLLSIVIQLSSGSFNKDQWPCRVEVEGPKVRILLENRKTDPILATLENGEFFSEPAPGPATYGLEGQMVAPGKLRGVVIPGPEPHPRVGIVDGRWGLDSLPLKDPLPSRREEIEKAREARAEAEAETEDVETRAKTGE